MPVSLGYNRNDDGDEDELFLWYGWPREDI